MTSFDDEFYRDILAGIAVYADSAFLRDVLATLTAHQAPGIAVALNKNQMASKQWLADSLHAAAGGRFESVMILGGWIGALAAVLLHDRRFDIARIVSIDIDPGCAPVALSLNATHVRAGRFEARTADMREIDYAREPFDLVINTSCEHVEDFERFYARVPDGQQLVLQSNDYVTCAEHVNCVSDLAAFRAQAPMRERLFEGKRRMRRYTRFMLIGRK
ncbi:MAG TPA: class I SAM-dependent methyltransferase [Casimicrobiaceae bacterium]|nr:class I SAM-dependent methyltransferase [Casimicrobiaceae bacterium]